MKKMKYALRDIRQGTEKAVEEIASLESFKPKKTQKKLLLMMFFIESITKQIDSFFEEMQVNKKAKLSLKFTRALDPLTLFGNDEEPKKTKVRKPAKKK
jgi:hypothetical protein